MNLPQTISNTNISVREKSPQKLNQNVSKKDNLRRYITITNTRSLSTDYDLQLQQIPAKHLIHKHADGRKNVDAIKFNGYPDVTYKLAKRRIPAADIRARLSLQNDVKAVTRLAYQIERLKNKDAMSSCSIYSSSDNTVILGKDSAAIKRHVDNLKRSFTHPDMKMKEAIYRYMMGNPGRIITPASCPKERVFRPPLKKQTASTSSKLSVSRSKTHPGRREKNDKEHSLSPLLKSPLPKLITQTPACMFKLFGPILLSAPHGIKLWRGGTDGRKKRIHYREIWVTEIVLQLALHIGKLTGCPASFLIWDRRIAMPADYRNLDPNYLTEKQFAASPFHEALTHFKKFGEENKLPILHIDLHGKKNRRTNMDVDFGFKALQTRWSDKGFVHWMKSECETRFQQLFESLNAPPANYTVNTDPLLCGDWGNDLYTMTCQSVCLGVPAFQLELPRTIRTHLVEDEEFMSGLAKCILDIYQTCILFPLTRLERIPAKENSDYVEAINKLYNDHMKLQKNSREKQI